MIVLKAVAVIVSAAIAIYTYRICMADERDKRKRIDSE